MQPERALIFAPVNTRFVPEIFVDLPRDIRAGSGDYEMIDAFEIEIIKNSSFFDAAWYSEAYPEVAELGMEPAEHYLWLGAKLTRDPGPSFSTRSYLELYPDVTNSGINPLVHFESHGRREGRLVGNISRSSHYSRRRDRHGDGRTRVAIFALFVKGGVINSKIEWYLSGLSEVVDHIIVVADNDLIGSQVDRLRKFTHHIIARRHGEYDFGSYKLGLQLASEAGLLEIADEVVICNDSCFGPIDSFLPMFKEMSVRDVDFWGISANKSPKLHLQSYFVVFKREAFLSREFRRFFTAVTSEDNVVSVILKYEVELTQVLERKGLRWDSFISASVPARSHLNVNPVHNPVNMLRKGSPLVKVKALEKFASNDDGMPELAREIRRRSIDVHELVLAETSIGAHVAATEVEFSIIMPIHNRATLVVDAINSVISQTHRNFELIIVDDGSTDGGPEEIEERYKEFILSGKIILHRLNKNEGVSHARNVGLRLARKPWIAYLDSDNVILPSYLTSFASHIVTNPGRNTFYARWKLHSDGSTRGATYDRARLERGNYIDLGVFVHGRELITRYGCFDEELKRLVDWDLILRLTAENDPVYLDKPLMVYSDDDDDSTRISIRESIDIANSLVRRKNGLRFRITTIIPTFNHESYISDALHSALAQEGDFENEIIVCSDGSHDRTPAIVAEIAERSGGRVRNLSLSQNIGISATFRRCINAATGDYIAILEGDDIWTDREKLQKQATFLTENSDCSMVFSKILVRKLPEGKDSFLPRQERLASNKLTGEDFLNDESMNLIANFSSCLFRSGSLKSAPERLFNGRFNEIALAFYLERFGAIGFINEAMSIYHQHENGVWSGSNRKEQLRGGLEVREMVLDLAHPKYREKILDIIDLKYRRPLAALETINEVGNG